MEDKDLGYEHRLTEVESGLLNHERRLEDVEKRQDSLDKLASCVATISTNQVHMDEDIKEIKSDVKDLTTKPVKRFDGLIDKVIFTAVGALITWLVTRVISVL